jgi:hypothetical protein
MKFSPMLLAGVCIVLAAQTPAADSPRQRYCTYAGPVELEISGSVVRGVYEITPKKITGTLSGTFVAGRIDALWQDADGRGNIVFLFDNDRRTFVSLIENSVRAPGVWTQGFWHGVLEGTKANDEEGNPALCAWTQKKPALPAN